MLITNDASIDLERLAIAGLGLVQFAKSTVTSQNLGKVLCHKPNRAGARRLRQRHAVTLPVGSRALEGA